MCAGRSTTPKTRTHGLQQKPPAELLSDEHRGKSRIRAVNLTVPVNGNPWSGVSQPVRCRRSARRWPAVRASNRPRTGSTTISASAPDRCGCFVSPARSGKRSRSSTRRTRKSVISSATPALTTEHEVRLTGLPPDTRHYYSVGSSGQALSGGDASHFFATAPSPGVATFKRNPTSPRGDR